MVRILRHRSFRHLWAANLLSLLGSQISRIGLLLYLFESRDSVGALALLVVVETLPGVVIAPFAGAVVDRFSKRGVMLAADLVRAALMGAILLAPTLGMIYLMAGLHAVVTVFFQPAKSAAIPLMLEPDDLNEANGADQAASNVMMILGPVVGAHLLVSYGLAATLLVDVATFLLSALLVTRLVIRPVPGSGERFSAAAVAGEIRDGWSYLLEHRLALHLNVLLFAALVCTGVWIPLAPFFIRDYLGAPEALLGWQLAVFGWGAVLGGLVAPRLVARFGRGVTLFGGFVAEAVALSVYATVPHPGASTGVIFLWGVAVSVIVVPFYSILQAAVEERFLGRVFSVVKQGESVAVFLAMLTAVALAERFGSHLILLATGLAYLALTLASTATRGGRTLLATP